MYVCFVSLHFRPFFPARSVFDSVHLFTRGTRKQKNIVCMCVCVIFLLSRSSLDLFDLFVQYSNVPKYWADGIALLYRTQIYWMLCIYVVYLLLLLSLSRALFHSLAVCVQNTFHCMLRVYICVPNEIRCACFSFLRTVAWLRLIFIYILRIGPSRKLASRRQLSIVFTPLTLY